MKTRFKLPPQNPASNRSPSLSYTKLEPRKLLSANTGNALDLFDQVNGFPTEAVSNIVDLAGEDSSQASSSNAPLPNDDLSHTSQDESVLSTLAADYVDDFLTPNPNSGWQYLWNENGEFGTPSGYTAMSFDTWRYRPENFDFPYLGATTAHPGSGIDEPDSGGINRFAIAAYTVGENGDYSITDSLITRTGAFGDGVEVSVHVNEQAIINSIQVAPTESASFDWALGTLIAGDIIYVGVGPDGPGNGSAKGNDGTTWDFSIMQTSSPSVTVSVDLGTQRYVGETTTLDRSKYFTFHSSGGGNDQQIADFQNAYDIGTGRQFWGPLPYAKNATGNVGTYPDIDPSTDQSVRATFPMVQTSHPRDAIRWDTDLQAAADWVTTYYTTVVDTVPKFFEPMNEPFVHAGDAEFADAPSADAMRLKMAELYAAIGEAVDLTPALADMNVVGYASAWPSSELWDFGHWDTRMKMFMDVAGEHMDAFSTHLYDGVNVTGQNNRRSGSNSEAILDLIETYSFAKWGFVKPHAITEFGGIEDGYGETYSDIRSAQSLRSINHLMFNLLEREDDLLISIPFISDKAAWFIDPANNCEPYTAALWRLDNPDAQCNGEFVHTWRINFFKLWKDVQGDRGLIRTGDPDIQAQLFVDGNTAYVAVNNLADQTQQVDLDFISGLSGLQNVEIRQMEVPVDAAQNPTYTETTQATAPDSITLNSGGTAVLVFNFDASLEFSETVRAQKYYTSQHLQPITANQTITFNLDGVETANSGTATLRMGIGRTHDLSKAPTLTVNGTEVDVPGDWKGYDQANRDDFFGVIDIDVPIDLLNINNVIEVTFPDTGGRVSSMILNVESRTSTEPVSRSIFYNESGFDGSGDSDAIAPDKAFLREGETATFNNYTSYVHGINGLVVDLNNGDASSISENDFEFKFGNEDNVDNWLTLSPNVTLTVDAGQGTDGSDRVLLEFGNGEITNGWLQVRVKASATTGLDTDNVFYFGNAIGETGNDPGNAIVNLSDIALTRSNQTGFSTTDVLDLYDFNRDARVNLADVSLARSNQSGFTPLRLITPTSGSNRASIGNGDMSKGSETIGGETKLSTELGGLPINSSSGESEKKSDVPFVAFDRINVTVVFNSIASHPAAWPPSVAPGDWFETQNYNYAGDSLLVGGFLTWTNTTGEDFTAKVYGQWDGEEEYEITTYTISDNSDGDPEQTIFSALGAVPDPMPTPNYVFAIRVELIDADGNIFSDQSHNVNFIYGCLPTSGGR